MTDYVDSLGSMFGIYSPKTGVDVVVKSVEVDNSINTITPKMYMSALKSAGIQGGHVYVTSPVSATGESALAGIMDCYEQATKYCNKP